MTTARLTALRPCFATGLPLSLQSKLEKSVRPDLAIFSFQTFLSSFNSFLPIAKSVNVKGAAEGHRLQKYRCNRGWFLAASVNEAVDDG